MNPIRALLNYLSRPQKITLYGDDKITIYKQGDLIYGKWINKTHPPNDSYTIAKLSEYIGNNYSGAWISYEHEKNNSCSTGMRKFFITRKSEGLYYMKWGKK